jgi:hypothetical protein
MEGWTVARTERMKGGQEWKDGGWSGVEKWTVDKWKYERWPGAEGWTVARSGRMDGGQERKGVVWPGEIRLASG